MAVSAKKNVLEVKKLVPAAPESGRPAGKRKRLAKAFERPLETKLRKDEIVRDKFSLLASEHERLAAMKQQLLAQGVEVKKSEILRAGLALLVGLDEAGLRDAVLNILPVESQPKRR